ncbi:MAG TPA: hypothetical protein VHF47_00435, partial [Acidimicrobiales bacterium]|nr:hypothetical protein [Acidimicrobiales bacterium]
VKGRTMPARRLPASLAIALATVASLMHPVLTGPSPAAAHTGFTSIDDNADADRTATINGTTMKIRVLRPSSGKPANGWPLVVYMAGDFTNRCANVNETSTRTSWYTRKQMAEHGFAVLSFNARGYPANFNAGAPLQSSTTSGCNGAEDAADALDDSGWDLAGPNDKQDIDDLIEWAVNSYTWSGCSSACIDGSQVGIFGAGLDARKALHMAVPVTTNPQFNARVKGVVAVGYGEWTVRNLKDVSSDGAATPAFRDVDQGLRYWLPDANSGYWSAADPAVEQHTTELTAAQYLNTAVPAATTTWLDDRAIVDDDETTADGDPRVDKAGLITDVPVFMANSFLDGELGITTATLAYNKLATPNKYLYLGPCGSTYAHLSSTDTGPCLTTTNGPNLREKVHAFLDRHVKGLTATSVGGPIFYAVPPASNPRSSDNWTVQTDSDGVWPPPGSTSTYCLGTDGGWYAAATCAEPTGTVSYSNLMPTTTVPSMGFCSASNYGTNEQATYTSPVLTGKMIGLEMDFWLLSSSTRSQVYVDVFDVDNATGSETRIWQGTAQVVPTARNVAPLTGVHYKFKPGGNAWTLASNHKIRIKIAAAYRTGFVQELLPATYYVWHDDYDNGTAPAKVSVTWAT